MITPGRPAGGGLLSSAGGVRASQPASQSDGGPTLRALRGLDAKVERSRVHTAPRRLYDLRGPTPVDPARDTGTPEPEERRAREVDEARITRLAADLTVKMDLSSLRFKAA